MDKLARHNQQEMDREILGYVRGMQDMAPVTAESVHRYLKNVEGRRRVAELDVTDRLAYLASAGYLEKKVEWDGGEVVHWRITADGMDVLDGNVPPRNWKGKQ